MLTKAKLGPWTRATYGARWYREGGAFVVVVVLSDTRKTFRVMQKDADGYLTNVAHNRFRSLHSAKQIAEQLERKYGFEPVPVK